MTPQRNDGGESAPQRVSGRGAHSIGSSGVVQGGTSQSQQPPKAETLDRAVRSADGRTTVIPDPDNPGMVTVRTRAGHRRRHTHSKKRRGNTSGRTRVLITVAGVLVGIVAAAFAAFAILSGIGGSNLHQMPEAVAVPASTPNTDSGKTVQYKGHTYTFNENVISVLFLGYDDETGYAVNAGASCSDANVLLTLDTSNNRVKCVTIPRDGIVQVDVYKEGVYQTTNEMQLCLAYAVADKADKLASENVAKSVSRLMYNIPLKYYFTIDEGVLEELTDSIGGVTVEALETIPGTDIVEGQKVILSGEEAYRYVQYRDISKPHTALSRQERQMQFVQAFARKASSLTAGQLVSLINSVRADAITNLGASEISYLARCFVTGDNAKVSMATIKGKSEMDDAGEHERYILNTDSVMRTVLDTYYTRMD